MAIWAEPRPTRKARSVDALKKSSDDPIIICTVARLFWAERKIDKARQWFSRAVVTNPDLGDSWAWWLKFERQHGIPVSEIHLYDDHTVFRVHHRNNNKKLLISVYKLNPTILLSGNQLPKTCRMLARTLSKFWN